ncbi:MAG TPA: PepSY-like domain-containing protein [Verrucomicrobiae bacterium]|nr:PepSY-like domain-containing protein [Verrucomicrobiae bacterium]
MKHLIPILAAAGLLVGCNQNVEKASQDFNALPPAVQKAVRSQEPNAEIANISQKTENGSDVYEIEFREPGTNPKMVVAADGRILSSQGTSKTEGVVGTIQKALTPTGAVGTKLSALPEKVQQTIQNTYPNAQVAGISRHEENGRVIYQIEFSNPGVNPSIQVAEDGTLVQGIQK